MKLYGHPESGHSFKVKFFLEVAGIDHEYEVIDIFEARDKRPREFRSAARFGEVPVLIESGRAYAQSNAILSHLATLTGRWGAQDCQTLARCREWLFWEANKIGMCLPQLRAATRFKEFYLETAAREWLSRRFDHDIGMMDAHLADGRRFFLGDEPTIVDFSLSGYLYLADEADVEVPENVRNWLDELSKLDGWKHPYALLKGNQHEQ